MSRRVEASIQDELFLSDSWVWRPDRHFHPNYQMKTAFIYKEFYNGKL